MVVIALYGSANSGKTETLRSLINEFLKTEASLLDPKKKEDLNKFLDVRCCLQTKDNKKVCITTQGDTGKIQDDNLLYVSKIKDVDVWITATHNYGQSVEEIWHSGILSIDEVIWVEKTRCMHIYKQIKGKWDNYIQIEGDLVKEGDFDACNVFDMNRIIRIFDKYC